MVGDLRLDVRIRTIESESYAYIIAGSRFFRVPAVFGVLNEFLLFSAMKAEDFLICQEEEYATVSSSRRWFFVD